jgi:hypothetical protein
MQRSKITLIIRIFLAIVFFTYGIVKIFGGQFYYGDWTIAKSSNPGPFLVWAFYGYSPVYGRFIGFAELIPALMLLNRRTATAGAAALFGVSLNIAVMDFGFDFPAVKWMAILYTALAAYLLWADRERLMVFLSTDEQVRAAASAVRATPATRRMRSAWSWTPVRVVGVSVAIAFLVFAANLVGTSLNEGPEKEATRILSSRIRPGEQLEFKRSRYTGLYGIGRRATMDFLVKGSDSVREVQVLATKANGFTDWRILEDSIRLSR